MPIKTVIFDVGETLVNETRFWNEWASYFGVPTEDFMGRLHDVIIRGRHHHEVYRSYDPNFELEEALRVREKA